MRIRNNFKAFVPSAGTGFAIRRDVLESFPDNNIFPVGSLTEDYKLSLEFKRRGYDLYYPLEAIDRVNYEGKHVKEYIATRSMFPRKYSAAVRQKARWIHGITMQSFKLSDILGNKNLNFATRYSFYKDWKAKFGNLLILPSYLIFIYFLSSLIFDLPIMYPKYSTSWYLMLVLTILMLHRQVARFTAVKSIYGTRSAMIASLFPPLLPFRLVLGNIINFHATVRAWKNHLIKPKTNTSTKAQKEPKKVKWAKTDHEFLPEAILQRYRVQLGDVLLRKEAISTENLENYVNQLTQYPDLNLRTMLMDDGIIEEKTLIASVCEVLRIQYIDHELGNFIKDQQLNQDNETMYKELGILPLFKFSNQLVLLTTVDEDYEAIQTYFSDYECTFAVTTQEELEAYRKGETVDHSKQKQMLKVQEALDLNLLTINQAVLAVRYCKDLDNLTAYFKHVGLLKPYQYFK